MSKELSDLLNALFKTIGVFITAIFLMAIPILCGLSFGLGWSEAAIFFLCVSVIIETLFLLFALAIIAIT